MSTVHGRYADGRPIDDAAIQAMADEAEAGYDVAALRQRGGRPAMGSGPASVESVRLDPELKAELLVRAAAEGISVSETIRRAIGRYVRAN